jgi:hypothetical protein
MGRLHLLFGEPRKLLSQTIRTSGPVEIELLNEHIMELSFSWLIWFRLYNRVTVILYIIQISRL